KRLPTTDHRPVPAAVEDAPARDRVRAPGPLRGLEGRGDGARVRERGERPARTLELPRRPARGHGPAGRGEQGGVGGDTPCAANGAGAESKAPAACPSRGEPATGTTTSPR